MYCQHAIPTYSAHVSLVRTILWLALMAGVITLGTGCSSLNASHSISPATFLLPGLMQVEPEPCPNPGETDQEPKQVAVNSSRFS